MKKIIQFLFTVIVSQTIFSQNVTVTIDAPLPVCNSGDCTTLQANYINTQPTGTYTVASIPYNPLFITTGGTLITSTNQDDVWSDTAFTLPFNFCFYGQVYNSVLIGSNGVVHFPNGSQSAAGFCPWSFSASIPNATFPIRNAIYGVYQDTDIRTPPVTNGAVQNVNYYIAGTAPNRVFVANFNQLPQFSCGAGVGLQTTQVILYETTNVIDVLVKNRTSCTTWNGGRGVIGVQNGTGTQAVFPATRNTGTWSATNEAWRFTPAQVGPTNTTLSWLANGVPIPGSTNVNPLSVCPTTSTTYTAQVDYLQCDGLNKTVTDNVSVGPEPPLPTLNPQNIVQCTTGAGPYTFNINQNTYMLNGAPASDYVFYYHVDNAGVPGAQIPNASLAAYTPASAVYPQTIWVIVEDQNTTGCTNLRSFTLNVVGAPSGSFSYASPFCDSETTPQAPTLTGLTSGGTYTASPAGLIINSLTGAITPNGSTPNTYTVSYNIPATASCPAYTAPPVNITINASPVAPTVNTVPATCSSDGVTTITNYNATYTYTFTPAGPIVGALGVINGMTTGTSYTVIANNGSCDSPTSVSFSNAAMLVTPAVPTIIATAPTCSTNGSSTVSNYNASETYVFIPAGPSVGAGGVISGMIIGTNYTVTAGNGSCTSAASAPFSNAPTATVPAVPTISTTAATCLADGSSTITNYNATQGYTFTPSGPSAGAGGIISGMIAGTSYTVTAANGSCTSASSVAFNNPVMLSTPAVPTITSTPPTCSADGSSVISNYNAAQTYIFTPVGPTVGAGGAISGMILGTNYTVTAGNGSCTSAASAPFNNAPTATVPPVPTITTTPATCLADGSSTITNYNATQTYTFTPSGPTAGAGGIISGMIAGTSYTVTAANGSCTSASSVAFNNPVILTTPAVPTITSTPPSCTADGSSTISNYNAANTYNFIPVGPTVGASGVISGMTIGVPYTVNASLGTCFSANTAPFNNAAMLASPATPTVTTVPATCSSDGVSTITNYNATYTYTFTPTGPTTGAGGLISGAIAGTSYSVIANNGSCNSLASAPFTNQVMLVTPAVPTVTGVGPTCTSDGNSTISNYNATYTYTFTPAGPTAGAGGLISGMAVGVSYTVNASLGSCTSANSTTFNNAAMLVSPATPTVTTLPATCASDGVSTITNYNASNTYTFTPTGPTAGAGGLISGATVGTSYTVIANNGSCNSPASAPFNNQVMLVTPFVPTITGVGPTCTANGSSTISNYNSTYTYTFTPAGPTVGTGGLINGMTLGVSYTVNASLGACISGNSTPSFSNAPMLVAPVAPTVTTVPATCSSDGVSTITNYNATYTYTFTPTGPTAGAGGLISGMTAGTSYTVIASNGSCNSPASAPFNNQVMLVTPAVPTISGVGPTCTANGSSTISNYNSTYTYTFTPAGPTVGSTGLINGMTIGVSYTVNASLGACFSNNTTPLFSNAPMLLAPVAPIVSTSSATCTSDGVSTITNYDATFTYTFTPAGPTAGAGGLISGATSGISYTVIANNGCNSPSSVAFNNPKMIVTPAPIANPFSYCLNEVVPSLTAIGTDLLWYTTSTGGTGSSTAPTPLTTSVGSTTYYVSQTLNGCESDRAAIVVTVSQPPVSAVIQPLPYFSDVNTITVTVDPPGVYEYSLDGGPFQNSNVFYNVPSGTHNVVVKNSCATLPPTPTTIVNYPKYFTPNADGIHDTWNIPFLNSQTDSKIEIFDRFGKLITVIQPSGNGWDGTYSNQQLPSTDYWFVVHYKENGVSKTHKAHFAMKR